FELRGMLEVQIAALAATRRSDADIVAMEQALDGMRTAPYGSVAWLKNDLGFHRAVAEATQNPYMGQFLVFVSERVRESILAAGNQQKSDDMARTTLGEHERILAAIKAGDAKGASSAMTRHLAGAASRVGLPGGEASAKPASTARHSRLRKAVRGQAAG
ncbi:FadR/GntR family transcriptional regulator, partial [Mesorhizobium sp.]